MCVNIMDAVFMVARHVSLTVETHMNNKISMEQRWKNTHLKEKRLRE